MSRAKPKIAPVGSPRGLVISGKRVKHLEDERMRIDHVNGLARQVGHGAWVSTGSAGLSWSAIPISAVDGVSGNSQAVSDFGSGAEASPSDSKPGKCICRDFAMSFVARTLQRLFP